MHVSAGVLTTRGGMTSHAAVVARGMGKVGLQDAALKHWIIKPKPLRRWQSSKKGDYISIDGSIGEVMPW